MSLGWGMSWDEGLLYAIHNLLVPELILLAGGAVAAVATVAKARSTR